MICKVCGKRVTKIKGYYSKYTNFFYCEKCYKLITYNEPLLAKNILPITKKRKKNVKKGK